MAVNKNQIAEDMRRIAQFFQTSVACADLLEQIGSLEGAVAEAARAKDAAYVERDSVVALVLAAKDELKAVNDNVADVRRNLQEEVIQSITDANTKAADIISAANVEAESLIAKASSEAATRRDAIVQSAARIQSDVDALNAEFVDKQAALIAVNADAIDAENRLAKAQAAIAKILGS